MSINLLLLAEVNTYPCLDTRPAHDLCGVLARGVSLEVIKWMVILEHVGLCLHTVHSDRIFTQASTVLNSVHGTGANVP